MEFVDRVHGTVFQEIRPLRPLSAIPVEILDVVAGTDSYFTSTPKNHASSKEVLKDIIHYLPGYGKSDEDLFIRTESHLPEAIENAKKLEKRCLESGYTLHGYGFSPSTEVYRMTELMIAVNSR